MIVRYKDINILYVEMIIYLYINMWDVYKYVRYNFKKIYVNYILLEFEIRKL